MLLSLSEKSKQRKTFKKSMPDGTDEDKSGLMLKIPVMTQKTELIVTLYRQKDVN